MKKRAIQKFNKHRLILISLFFIGLFLLSKTSGQSNNKTPASTAPSDRNIDIPASELAEHPDFPKTSQNTKKAPKSNSKKSSFLPDIVAAAKKKKEDVVQRLHQKNQELRSKLEQITDTCRKLSQENTRQSNHLAQLTAELQQKRKQLRKTKSEDSEKDKRVNKLQLNLKDIRQDYQRATTQLFRLNKEIKRLRTLEKNWLSTIQQNNRWHTLLLELAERNDLPESIQQKINQTLSENVPSSQQSDDVSNLTSKIVTLSGYSTDPLKVKKLSRPPHEVSRKKLVAYVEHLQQVKDRLRNRLEDLKPVLNRLEDLALALERKQELINELRQKIKELESTKIHRTKKLNSLQKQITDLRDRNADLRTILQNVEKKKASYTKRYNRLQKNTVNQEQRIMNLGKKLEDKTRNLKKMRHERKKLEKRLEDLKDIIAKQEKLLTQTADTPSQPSSHEKIVNGYIKKHLTTQKEDNGKEKFNQESVFQNLKQRLQEVEDKQAVVEMLNRLQQHFAEADSDEQPKK